MSADSWTLVFKEGVPRDWARAAGELQQACAGRFALADATRAIRQGFGVVDVLLSEAEAKAIEARLTAAGFEARALLRSELEPAQPPVRFSRVDFGGDEAVPGLPWASIHVVHLARVQPAPFYMPPDVSAGTRSAHRVAGVMAVGVKALGVPDFGTFKAMKQATGAMIDGVAATSSAPELIIELVGVWTPRVHLAVASYEFSSVPGVSGPGGGGSRARLAALLEALVAKLPGAQREGQVARALAKQPLDELVALPTAEHRRMVSAWLTRKRLWPG
jgi:hypothetical protein